MVGHGVERRAHAANGIGLGLDVDVVEVITGDLLEANGLRTVRIVSTCLGSN